MAETARKITTNRNVFQVLKSWYGGGQKKPRDNIRQTSTTSIAITTTKDLVGPPDPISNIRPITFHVPELESTVEKKYRLRRQAVQAWHQSFWARHNAAFLKNPFQYHCTIVGTNVTIDCSLEVETESQNLWDPRVLMERKEFEKAHSGPMSSDDMSVFYKSFLDKYWVTHLKYAKQWYFHNFQLLALAAQVECRKMLSPLIK